MRYFLGFLVVGVGFAASVSQSVAADYAVPPAVRHTASIPYIDRGPNPYCGPRCGCPIVVKVRHRSLEQGYPSSFDPRTRGEPNYYYGRVRTYVRFAHPAYPEHVLQY